MVDGNVHICAQLNWCPHRVPLRHTVVRTAKRQGHTGGLQPRVESHLGLLGFPLPAADPTALLQGGTQGASKNNNNNKINKIKIKIKNKVQDSISGSEKRS